MTIKTILLKIKLKRLHHQFHRKPRSRQSNPLFPNYTEKVKENKPSCYQGLIQSFRPKRGHRPHEIITLGSQHQGPPISHHQPAATILPTVSAN